MRRTHGGAGEAGCTRVDREGFTRGRRRAYARSGASAGASPSGKAADFDSAIRRFESSRPNQSYFAALSGVYEHADRLLCIKCGPRPASIRRGVLCRLGVITFSAGAASIISGCGVPATCGGRLGLTEIRRSLGTACPLAAKVRAAAVQAAAARALEEVRAMPTEDGRAATDILRSSLALAMEIMDIERHVADSRLWMAEICAAYVPANPGLSRSGDLTAEVLSRARGRLRPICQAETGGGRKLDCRGIAGDVA